MPDKKILLVEDDKDLLLLMNKKLTDEGFSVAAVETGQEALDFLEKDQPDLVLLDILLPDIDGLTVLNEIASNKKTKNIPVIILTALVQDSDKERGIKGGADDYIVKSETMPGEVIEKIKALLEKYSK